MKCRAQQQGFCLLPRNQITEVEINTPLTTGLLPDSGKFCIYIFPFHFRSSVLMLIGLYGHQVCPFLFCFVLFFCFCFLFNIGTAGCTASCANLPLTDVFIKGKKLRIVAQTEGSPLRLSPEWVCTSRLNRPHVLAK